MNPLDCYLEAVRKFLPWQRQDDIIAELRANLESQLEDREAEMGRPLDDAEMKAWIKQLGLPMHMAARYRPQQSLIGPALFPVYSYVLKLACTWGSLAYALATVVTIFVGKDPTAGDLIAGLVRAPLVLITIGAWVTLAFAAVEYAVLHGYIAPPKEGPFSANWAPDNLPTFDFETMKGKKPKSFAQAVAETIFGVFFLGWLLLVPQHPWVLFGPGAAMLQASPYQLAPVWMQFYWFLVALNVFQICWEIVRLWQGKWQGRQPVKHIISKTLALIPCFLIITVPDQAAVLLRHPELDQAAHAAGLQQINYWIHRGFMVAAAIAVVQLAWDVTQLGVASYRKRAAAAIQ